MLKERDDRLNDSSELQRFLQDLDHFQMWLSRAQTTVASEDVPNTLTVSHFLNINFQSTIPAWLSSDP